MSLIPLRDLPQLARDGSNLDRVMASVREALQTFRGYRGDPLDRAVTLRDLDVSSQRTLLGGGTFSGGGTGPVGPAGPAGPPGGDPTPDPTPPPTATGLVVTAGFSNIYISCDQPVYTQGHGHGTTVVYGSKWPTSDPTPPTFSEAVKLFEFLGTFDAYPTTLGTRWCIWIKWKSNDGYESVNPAGGTNGVQATTGVIGNADLGPLIIEAENLANGSVNGDKLSVGAIAAGSAAIANGAIVNAMIANATIDNAKIANMSVAKLTGSAMAVGAYIQSTNYVPGVSGWGIFASGTAEFGAASIRGQLVASQINSRGLDILDPSGNVVLAAGASPSLSWSILGDQPGPNLIAHPELEPCSNGDTTAPGWTRTTTGTPAQASILKPTTSPSYGPPWSRNAPVLYASVNEPSESVRWFHTDLIPVEENTDYTLACWARQYQTSEARVYFGLICYDNAGANLGSVYGLNFVAISQSWARRSFVFGPSGIAFPAGTVAVRPQWYGAFNSAGTSYTGDTMATRFTFNEGRVATNSYAPFNAGFLSPVNPLTGTNVSTYIANAAISAAQIGSLNADVINAGAIRGINVNASSHTTTGSYLTSAAAAAATTLQVKNTTDFPASGTAFIIDSTNDRDTITYTGKTANSLTGCSGVLAHNAGATIIPRTKAMVIDAATNEMRFFGDRGDGTVEEVASVGLRQSGSDIIIIKAGATTTGHSRQAIVGESNSGVAIIGRSISDIGIYGISTDSNGVRGDSSSATQAAVYGVSLGAAPGVEGRGGTGASPGMYGLSSGTGPGVDGDSLSSGPGIRGASTTGYGGSFTGNATRAALFLTPVATPPSNNTVGQFAVVTTPDGPVLCYARSAGSSGPGWYKVHDNTFWNL